MAPYRTDIRTYGIVTLNEECGFIQWVPDTVPVRFVLLPLYEARGQKSWVCGYQGDRTLISRRRNRTGNCMTYLKGLRTQLIMRLARYLRKKFCQCKLDNTTPGCN